MEVDPAAFDQTLASIEQYREDMHYDQRRAMTTEAEKQEAEERASMFARAVSLSATAFAEIKAAIPGPEDAPPTVEQAERARDLCDTLSSATFDLLMAALNSTTALSTIASALHDDATEEEL